MSVKSNPKDWMWVEKYRPSSFNDIVFDPLNKQLLENIIKNKLIHDQLISLV